MEDFVAFVLSFLLGIHAPPDEAAASAPVVAAEPAGRQASVAPLRRPGDLETFAPTKPSGAESKAGLSCELAETRHGDEHVIVAYLRADSRAAGSFKLRLEKRDSDDNTVKSRQDGVFRIQGGDTQVVANATFNIARGEILAGWLELRDPKGNLLTNCNL